MMMVVAFAVKLGTLAVKTFSKPIANCLTREASCHPLFRKYIVNLGQMNHKVAVNMQRQIYGRTTTELVLRPLEEEEAVKSAAALMAEMIAFTAAGSVIICEAQNSITKSKMKEDRQRQELQEVKTEVASVLRNLLEHIAEKQEHNAAEFAQKLEHIAGKQEHNAAEFAQKLEHIAKKQDHIAAEFGRKLEHIAEKEEHNAAEFAEFAQKQEQNAKKQEHNAAEIAKKLEQVAAQQAALAAEFRAPQTTNYNIYNYNITRIHHANKDI